MAVPDPKMPVPQVVPEPARPTPEPEYVPAPARPKRRLWWVVLAAVVVAAGAWLYVRLAYQRAPAQVAVAPAIPTATVTTGAVERTIRFAGTTRPGRYVNLVVPRMYGSRSRRGADVQASAGLSMVTVQSTSSVAPRTSMSALSQTGTVTSTSAAQSGGGGLSGAPRGASGALSAVTTRVGGGSGSGSRITVGGSSGSSAVGQSGIGSTAGELVGGSAAASGAGGGRGGGPGGGFGGGPRGEFTTVLQKLVPAGTVVKKGDIVAEFDRQFMLLRLQDYEAAVAQHEANVRKTQAEIDVARKAHEVQIKGAKAALEKAKLDMQASPVLSAIQAEQLRLSLEQAEARYKELLEEAKYKRISEEAQLREAELELREANLELERARMNADRLLVRAPMDGMVVLLDVFRGGQFSRVREGDMIYSGQPFAQIVDPTSMLVQAEVNQVDVENLRIGMKARVHFEAFPDLVLPARVYSIGTVARPSQFRGQWLTKVPVVLKLEKVDPRVIPDLSVAVEVIVEQETNVASVPLQAVFSDGSGQPFVYVKRGENWEIRPVQLGLRNYLVAAVRSGLRPGEVVALKQPPQEKILR